MEQIAPIDSNNSTNSDTFFNKVMAPALEFSTNGIDYISAGFSGGASLKFVLSAEGTGTFSITMDRAGDIYYSIGHGFSNGYEGNSSPEAGAVGYVGITVGHILDGHDNDAIAEQRKLTDFLGGYGKETVLMDGNVGVGLACSLPAPENTPITQASIKDLINTYINTPNDKMAAEAVFGAGYTIPFSNLREGILKGDISNLGKGVSVSRGTTGILYTNHEPTNNMFDALCTIDENLPAKILAQHPEWKDKIEAITNAIHEFKEKAEQSLNNFRGSSQENTYDNNYSTPSYTSLKYNPSNNQLNIAQLKTININNANTSKEIDNNSNNLLAAAETGLATGIAVNALNNQTALSANGYKFIEDLREKGELPKIDNNQNNEHNTSLSSNQKQPDYHVQPTTQDQNQSTQNPNNTVPIGDHTVNTTLNPNSSSNPFENTAGYDTSNFLRALADCSKNYGENDSKTQPLTFDLKNNLGLGR